MPYLNLKPHDKPVQTYYREINQIQQLSFFHEGAVAPHFSKLLQHCGNQFKWTLIEQYPLTRKGRHPLKADGALLDEFKLLHGLWEAKDSRDDLPTEVKKKFQAGYPQDNILFQAPDRALLYQNGQPVIDADLTQPAQLVDTLKLFFAYQPPAYEQWERAVDEFKDKVPELARSLLSLIDAERQQNRAFMQALNDFIELARQTINPNISLAAVEEMLIQHLLTERIFRQVFNNPDFASRNIIAVEIEKVIQALTSRHFSRSDFLSKLDRFYGAIETTAATIDDFTQKQAFLNTVYEKFFQGFSVKVADTHGIVYTPQPIVDFMVRSVDDILQKEFGKSLGSPGVHILDPFVGTGNFILHVMRQIPKTQLPDKYARELHCNEVMLLPYYIAAMNIEHEYVELTGHYQPFEGICLVDTFELTEGKQMPLFAKANTERVVQQKQAPIFVIIGNPPYNAGQINENDNNKNRKYEEMDKRIAKTYVRDSKATLNNALYDPYVKAIRWASDRIDDEGIVAFVTNNSFVDQIAFDGMRKHLAQDFDRLYVLDLKGNIRKDSMRDGIPLGEKHTVFGLSAMVGVAVTFLVRGKHFTDKKIFYSNVHFRATRLEKFDLLENAVSISGITWQEITPNKKIIWLTEGLQADFETFLPIGSKAIKNNDKDAIFKDYSRAVCSNEDAYVYNFNCSRLIQVVQRMIDNYSNEYVRWISKGRPKNLNECLNINETVLKWIRNTKRTLLRGKEIEFEANLIRKSSYRPFCNQWYYFERAFSEDTYQFPHFFPAPDTENYIICLTDKGSEKPFMVLMTDKIADLHIVGAGCSAQCFPFYVYDEDGANRRENITDWALEQFRARYLPSPLTPLSGGEGNALSPLPLGEGPGVRETINKWDIFHYVYALLHHPTYRRTYAANLRRDLPHIPFASNFWDLAEAGAKLAHLHVTYEQQPAYPLQFIEAKDAPLDWRVEKMRLSPDKTQLKVNAFLTLAGIPPQAFEYKLGNRSALDWVIDQYQVSTDPRSGLVNDPNRPDDPQYIVRLIGQVITVSLETVKIVNGLPPLEIITQTAEVS